MSPPAPKLSASPRLYVDSLAARATSTETEGRTLVHIIAWGVCIVVACTIMGFGR